MKNTEQNLSRSAEIARDENSNGIAISSETQKSHCNSISEKSHCILRVKNLFVSYGGINALRGVNIDVARGQIVSLIGANGAGKSTLLRTISGLVKAQSGNIEFLGEEILGNAIDLIRSVNHRLCR